MILARISKMTIARIAATATGTTTTSKILHSKDSKNNCKFLIKFSLLIYIYMKLKFIPLNILFLYFSFFIEKYDLINFNVINLMTDGPRVKGKIYSSHEQIRREEIIP